ncbi:MAG: hypothetical protein AAB921_03890 [Patescibacteria group bacterium]
MPFNVFDLFIHVLFGAVPAPATTTSRDDGAGTNKPPLVGGEDFAQWGTPERARGHG